MIIRWAVLPHPNLENVSYAESELDFILYKVFFTLFVFFSLDDETLMNDKKSSKFKEIYII